MPFIGHGQELAGLFWGCGSAIYSGLHAINDLKKERKKGVILYHSQVRVLLKD